MTRIAIIDGHPDPEPDRFVHALAEAYACSALEAGHEVRRLDVAQIEFPLVRSAREWTDSEPCLAIRRAQQDIFWADHVVLAYPLWLGDVPALLKGFLEQVARPGFAVARVGGDGRAKLLAGRSARIIVTMGMPDLFYRLVYRAHSLKSLERNILGFVGFSPVRHSIVGNVDKSDEHRKTWLKQVAALAREAI